MRRFALALFAVAAVVVSARESEQDEAPFITSLAVTASPMFSVGSTGDMYTLGGGGDFAVYHRLDRLDFLQYFVGAGFNAAPLLDQSSSLLLADLSAGAALEFEIVPRLNFGAAFSAGVYMGRLVDPPETGWGATFAGRVSLGYDITGRWRLGAGATFRTYPGLAGHLSGDVFASYRRDFVLDDPFGAVSMDIEPLYPVLAGYYNAPHPIGRLSMTNVGDADWTKVGVSFDARGITRGRTDVPVVSNLESGRTASVGLIGKFPEQEARGVREESGEARTFLEFRYKGWPQERQIEGTIPVYSADFSADPRSAVLFVASRDPVVRNWGEEAAARNLEVSEEINTALVRTAAILGALTASGFRTIPESDDVWTDLAAGGGSDRYPFPRDTLLGNRGDRSETAILTAALLESTGIPAGLAVIDGELWPAASLGEGVERIEFEYAKPQDLVIVEGIGWAVLDTTDASDVVLAVGRGAEAWRSSGEEAFLIPCRAAWEDYPQTGYSRDPVPAPFPDSARLTQVFAESIDSLVRWEIASRRKSLEDSISASPRNVDLLNRLGALLARYGLREEAAVWFDKALLLEDDARALVNMGNIEYLAGDLVRARTYYNQAARVDPFNPIVLLGIARVSFEQENFGSSRDAYSKLEVVDPELADRFSVLTGTGPDALQAALDSELRRVVFWLE